jgi:hypothetical protein
MINSKWPTVITVGPSELAGYFSLTRWSNGRILVDDYQHYILNAPTYVYETNQINIFTRLSCDNGNKYYILTHDFSTCHINVGNSVISSINTNFFNHIENYELKRDDFGILRINGKRVLDLQQYINYSSPPPHSLCEVWYETGPNPHKPNEVYKSSYIIPTRDMGPYTPDWFK